MIWHPFTPQLGALEPLKIVRAQKEYLYDESGKEYVDAIASWWTVIHGHCHPKIMEAIRLQVSTLDHVLLAGFTHAPAEEVAVRLIHASGNDFARVFFSDNGSTAVEVMLKLALQFWANNGNTQRTKFVCFEPAYHGDTVGAMSVAGDSLFNRKFSPLLFDAKICVYDGSDFREYLEREAENVAAIIIEPLIAAAGGMVFQSTGQLRNIVETAHAYGVLVLFDEVFTGMGRTGKMFAYQTAEVKPDLVALAKGLTGGSVSMAATLVSEKIYQAFVSDDPQKTFYHGHTMTGNPIAAAAAVASLRLFDGENTLEMVALLQIKMQSHWQRLLEKYGDRISNVRVLGAVSAVDLISRIEKAGYVFSAAKEMRRIALQEGVVLRPLGNVIYVTPPYNISDVSLARVFDAIGVCLQNYK